MKGHPARGAPFSVWLVHMAAMGASVPFRRLVAERRIRFTYVGRFVRIPESALREFIKAGTVEPVTAWAHHRSRKAA